MEVRESGILNISIIGESRLETHTNKRGKENIRKALLETLQGQ